MQRFARIAFVLAACFTFVMALLPHPPQMPGQPSDKLMHMLAFATLGILGAHGFRRRSVLQLLVGLTLFGAMIELLQAIPSLHHESDVRDLIADMLAALLALVITRSITGTTGRSKEN